MSRWVLCARVALSGCGGEESAEPAEQECPGQACEPNPEPEPVPRPEPEPEPEVVEPEPEAQPEVIVDISAPLSPQNDFGPAGRVVTMIMPETAREARSSGCIVHGAKVGTGLNSLIQLAGGLEQFLKPGPDGQIPLLLMAQMKGWEAGQGSGALESVDLRFYEGRVGAQGELLVKRSSFVDGDPEGALRMDYPATAVDGGWLETPEGEFFVTVPFLGFLVNLHLIHTLITGQVFADGPGAGMVSGVLTGYIDEDGVIGLLRDIQSGCSGEDAPAICGAISNVFPLDKPPEESVDTVVSFVGGYDVRLEEGFPYPCQPEGEPACNALGMCILMELAGVEVGGLEAE